MYAVIHTGGKQYRVAKNDVIQVEKLPGAAGETIELDRVLMLGDGAEATIGAPLVDGALVSATILEQMRGPKIIVFKKKRRKNYRRTRGHRQDLTVLRITDIVPAGAKPAKAQPEAKPAAKEAKPETPAKPATAQEAKTPAKAANDADKPKAAKASTKAAKSAKLKAATGDSPAKAGRGSSKEAKSEESSEESK